MAIRAIEESKELRKYGKSLGREGMARRIIEIAKEITTEKGAYISTLVLAGKIRAICIAAKCDGYWDEKQDRGYTEMYYEAKHHNFIKVTKKE